MILPERYKNIEHPIILENISDINNIQNIYVKYFAKDITNTEDEPLKYLYRIDSIVHDSKNIEILKVVYEPVVFMEKPIRLVQDFDEFFSLVNISKYPNAKQKFSFETISTSELCKYIDAYMYMHIEKREIKWKWLKDDDVK